METTRNQRKKPVLRKGGYQYEMFPNDMEHPTGPSLTVPDQSMSLNEMLRRHAAGTAPANAQNPLYEDEANFDSADYTKIKSLDLSEQDEIKRALSTNIDQMKDKLKPKPKAETPVVKEQPEPTEEPVTKAGKKATKPTED